MDTPYFLSYPFPLDMFAELCAYVTDFINTQSTIAPD